MKNTMKALVRLLFLQLLIAAALIQSSSSSSSSEKVIQVQIVHRHGDRTPITPMLDKDYWSDTLPEEHLLDKLAADTDIIRHDEEAKKQQMHGAAGSGVFGQLTKLGLLQMVELGSRIKEEIEALEHITLHDGPSSVHVVSTDFPRTIQSVQALLVGLFPDDDDDEKEDGSSQTMKRIQIDARHTDILIPDPQPRRSNLQVKLEQELASHPEMLAKEEEMKHLAVRTTAALHHLLDHSGVKAVSFGVGEEKKDDDQSKQTVALPWGQLAEITKCLKVRGLLPSNVTQEDQELISKHAAHRWFSLLRHPTMAAIAMDQLVKRMLTSAKDFIITNHDDTSSSNNAEKKPLHVYSAHDSSLIGLICAFHLEMPAEWPDYASYFKMELLEITEKDDNADEGNNSNNIDHCVRFSLNGTVLRCCLNDKKMETIRLEELLSSLICSSDDSSMMEHS